MDAKQRASFINSIAASPVAAVKDKPAAPAPAAAVQAEEEENAFAQGLPDWDLVPPQLSVRRRRTV